MTSTIETPCALEVVESVYRAFESQDVAAVFALFAEDIVITQSEELPWGGTYRGHQEAGLFFQILTSHIATQVSVDQFIVAGDTVVEQGRTEGKALDTGRDFSIAETHVFKVRDGKVVQMDAYVDNEAMLGAIMGSFV